MPAGEGGKTTAVYLGNMAAMIANTSCEIPECKRPRFEKNGIVHNFCGRTHAKEALSRGLIKKLLPPHGRCHVSYVLRVSDSPGSPLFSHDTYVLL